MTSGYRDDLQRLFLHDRDESLELFRLRLKGKDVAPILLHAYRRPALLLGQLHGLLGPGRPAQDERHRRTQKDVAYVYCLLPAFSMLSGFQVLSKKAWVGE